MYERPLGIYGFKTATFWISLYMRNILFYFFIDASNSVKYTWYTVTKTPVTHCSDAAGPSHALPAARPSSPPHLLAALTRQPVLDLAAPSCTSSRSSCSRSHFSLKAFWIRTAKNQCRKLVTNIPRKGFARSQSHFPQSCVCERFIYSHGWSCWRKYVDWSLEYINHSQTHECGSWDWGRAIPRKGIP